ncbi:MAG: hypothetical protein ILM98_06695 [Kiritimatiellae bacterium]|nr:hypothetical protein [Kiritimatiellia bacterium]
MNIEALEKERIEEQTRIDATRSIEARRSLGQFATPSSLARDIARETAPLLEGSGPVEMLEPSAGTGAFLSAFFSEQAIRLNHAIAVEIDPAFHELQKRIWRGFPVESRMADFTTLAPDCTGKDMAELPKSIRDYLAEGELTTATKKLCAGRIRWYDQEQRKPAPILCSYMGRGNGIGAPVRFILNTSNAIATNSFLMLYPKGALRRLFAECAENSEAVWLRLRSIPPEEFSRAGRCYGGGLHKMEPRELGDLTCSALVDWLSGCVDYSLLEEDSGQLLLAMEDGADY